MNSRHSLFVKPEFKQVLFFKSADSKDKSFWNSSPGKEITFFDILVDNKRANELDPKYKY